MLFRLSGHRDHDLTLSEGYDFVHKGTALQLIYAIELSLFIWEHISASSTITTWLQMLGGLIWPKDEETDAFHWFIFRSSRLAVQEVQEHMTLA